MSPPLDFSTFYPVLVQGKAAEMRLDTESIHLSRTQHLTGQQTQSLIYYDNSLPTHLNTALHIHQQTSCKWTGYSLALPHHHNISHTSPLPVYFITRRSQETFYMRPTLQRLTHCSLQVQSLIPSIIQCFLLLHIHYKTQTGLQWNKEPLSE